MRAFILSILSAAMIILSAPGASAQEDTMLTITSWNLGYGGLGEESDFRSDGGSMLRVPGKDIAQKNVDGIASWLAADRSNIILLQELSEPSFPNRYTDLKGAVEKRSLRNLRFDSYAKVRGFFSLRPRNIGYGRLSNLEIDTAFLDLENEPGGLKWFYNRDYFAQISRFNKGGKDWAVIHVHLAAFDEGGQVRQRQLATVIDLAQTEFAGGRYVVIGGDFNLVLGKTAFPHTTEEEYLFWLIDFPENVLPEGWSIATDLTVPSVRTNQKPYVEGENYRSVIDGFIVSPNVSVESVTTTDLAFKFSDHQPVTLKVSAK